MSKDKSSKQVDADILQCRADILRARDITPPYDEKSRPPNDLQQTDKNISHSDAAAKPPTVTTVNNKPAVTRGELVEPTNRHAEHEIPKFDLAEEIMAEQRRITAVKRKAPTKKIEAVTPPSAISPTGFTGLSQRLRPLAQKQIIAEIVARDIEKLCHGDMLDVRQQDFEDIARGTEQDTPPQP